MPDTIQEQIIAAFTARAAPLSALPVERARRSINESGARFVSIWDGNESAQPPAFGAQQLRFPVAVECVWKLAEGENPSVRAMAVKGEVLNTMIGPGLDRTFGGLAQNVMYVSEVHTYPQDGGKHVSLMLVFNIDYATAAGDPFTLPS